MLTKRRVIVCIAVVLTFVLVATLWVRSQINGTTHEVSGFHSISAMVRTSALPKLRVVRVHGKDNCGSPRPGVACRYEWIGVVFQDAIDHTNLYAYYQSVQWKWDVVTRRWVGPRDYNNWHWVNGRLDNFWEYDTQFAPVVNEGQYPGSYKWERRSRIARFQYCIFRVGCIHSREEKLTQQVTAAGGYSGWTD